MENGLARSGGVSRGDYVLLCKPKETLPTFLRIIGIFVRGYVDWAVLLEMREIRCAVCAWVGNRGGSSVFGSVRFGRESGRGMRSLASSAGFVIRAVLWTGGFFVCEFRRFLVEDEFRFVLAPAYSLFVGAAVKKQSGEKIRFVVEDIDDEALKDSLRRAFKNHLDYLHESGGRAEKSAGRPEVSFVAGNRRKIRRYILKKHGELWKLLVV